MLSKVDLFIQSKNYSGGLKLAKKLLKNNAVKREAFSKAIFCATQLGDQKEALTLYKKAHANFSNDDAILQNFAGFCFSIKRIKDALTLYLKLLKRHPEDGITLANIAACHLFGDDVEQAEEFALKAIETGRTSSNAYDILGTIYLKKGRVADAESQMITALEQFQPSLHSAYNYLQFCENHNQYENCERVFASLPDNLKGHPSILLQMGIVLSRVKQYEPAYHMFEQALAGVHVLDTRKQKKLAFEYGKLLDKMGRSEEAFTAFQKGNAIAKDLCNLPERPNQNDLINLQARIIVAGDDVEEAPVFVIGFPRTGTTLVDQILSTDCNVQSFEESAVLENLFDSQANLIEASAVLDRSELQRRFFREYRESMAWDGKSILVDRSAPNFVRCRFIRSLFPNAKIIILHRHPCDVVLSCFMQDFAENQLTREFFDLKSTAELYDHAMSVVKMDEQMLSVRYEDLIEDFDNVSQKIFNFLGLTWTEDTRDFYKTALNKEAIRTASYHQVTKPLYKDALNRWERYRGEMEPVLPLLSPWIKALGYT
ncbi:MAG: sulfotransferase [Terasakiella sp.]|uniref:sulfotransferase n=1 Tax=unclassified Terasakiella TaxID=2614952 RepID=UPI003B00C202